MKQEARPSDGLESPGFSRWEEVNNANSRLLVIPRRTDRRFHKST